MARVLLFGATGFLGQAVASALRADPRVDTVLAAGRRQPAAMEWVRHDLVTGSPDQLAQLLTKLRPDAVVNCAGRLTGTYAELVAANTGAVAQLVDAIAQAAPQARLVTLGSAAEYGVVKAGRPVQETDLTCPVSGYGVTRLAATRLVELAATTGQLDAVVLRVFNPIGPGLPEANVAGRAIRELHRALSDGTGEIQLGPLGAYRDFVDVRDVAGAVVAAVFARAPRQVVCNVGSGTATSARTLVRLLADAAGFTGIVTESQPPSARSVGVDWIAADLHHTVAALGWAPLYSL
ncbi:MAG: NAD-dependent epimerase/dehydratase family protein, partial [Micromonosporaceae bacterium]